MHWLSGSKRLQHRKALYRLFSHSKEDYDEAASSGIVRTQGPSYQPSMRGGENVVPGGKLRYKYVRSWKAPRRLPIFAQGAATYMEGVGDPPSEVVTLTRGNNKVRLHPLAELNKPDELAIDIECVVWAEFPKAQAVSRAIMPGSWFSGYGLSFTGGRRHLGSYLELDLPTSLESLRLYFEERGYLVGVSQDGQYALAFVNSIGGIGRLQPVASLAAYHLLDVLAPKSALKLAQYIDKHLLEAKKKSRPEQVSDILEALQASDLILHFDRNPRNPTELYEHLKNALAVSSVNITLTQVVQLLQELSSAQVVRRGLFLECRNCATSSWYPLMVIDETVVCPGCATRFLIPVEYGAGSAQETRIQFRVNSLVERVMDQDGLPAVLALYHLGRSMPIYGAIPGLDISGPSAPGTAPRSKAAKEFDFIFVSNQRLHAGECKAGMILGEKDLDLARLAAATGVDYFYYCTVAEFSEESRAGILAIQSELRASGMSILTLEGTDLLGGIFAKPSGP